MKVALQDRRFPPAQTSRPITRPPPVNGWNTKDNAALMQPGWATTLDNWIPRSHRVEVRKGAIDHATGLDAAIETLMAYRPASGTGKLFAATEDGLYEVTTAGAIGAVASAATGARWAHTNFATSAGQFLCAVNGVDDYRYYNGSTWTTVATFTLGAGTLDTDTLIGINVHQSRLYFIAKDSLRFYFLDTVGTLFGTVIEFNLDQVFSMGGHLVAMGSWTFDGGDGPEDRAVFVSSEGQLAVYTGTDPADTAKWKLVGTFYIGRPVGQRCLTKLAGDLILLTESGLFPLSKALGSAGVNRSIALSNPIEPTLVQQALRYFNEFGWQLFLHHSETLLLVTVPSQPRAIFAMDLLSKGWCRILGWDAYCLESLNGTLYYGTEGKVVKAFEGTVDFDSEIQAEMITAFDYFSKRGQTKHLELLRPHFQATTPFSFALGANVDFELTVPSVHLSAQPPQELALWDTAIWDQDTWGSDGAIFAEWYTVSVKPGHTVSLYLKTSSRNTTPALLAVDYLLSSGGVL